MFIENVIVDKIYDPAGVEHHFCKSSTNLWPLWGLFNTN